MKNNNRDMYNVNGELTLLLNSYNTIITGAYSINPVYKNSALKFFVENFDKTVKEMGESEDQYNLPASYSLDEIKYCINKFINREEINSEELKLAQMFITEMFFYKHKELTKELFTIYHNFFKEEVYSK